ncbi:MAG: metalloprotease family protein [Clostridium sp.]|uniref:metalloprotease family protein n=1 Tax=Clostridium sp. TaxID=1506 RepID=UPI003D6C7B8D
MEVSAKPIQRVKFLIVLLLPVTVISVVSLFLPLWVGGMIFFLNLLGSSGDLLMAFSLMKLDS